MGVIYIEDNFKNTSSGGKLSKKLLDILATDEEVKTIVENVIKVDLGNKADKDHAHSEYATKLELNNYSEKNHNHDLTYSKIEHSHSVNEINDFPNSLPANGGNSNTVNNLTVETAVPKNAKFTDTVYTHPNTHPASIIVQDENNRFVTDAEKLIWNNKLDEVDNSSIYARSKGKWVNINIDTTDLSRQDALGNIVLLSTANCYIVRRSGIYKFPLVYGNAIKDGKVNTPAFTNIAVNADCHDFVNYSGNIITQPYIEIDLLATDAVLTVSDVDQVIKNVEIIQGNDCRYIQFEVVSIPEQGGNGIISVRTKDDEGNDLIMWNWHIWLFKKDLSPIKIVNFTNLEYYVMPYNLATTFDEDLVHYKNWLYLWGRITPIIGPKVYNSNTNLILYGTLLIIAPNDGSITYLDSILNPTTHYTSSELQSYNWFSTKSYYNLWDANCSKTGASDNDTVKTVYDPSPVGFKVNNGRTYTGFTLTGNNSTNVSLFNVIGDFKNGWTFKRNLDDSTGMFIPAAGYRDFSSGGLYSVGASGYVWSAASGSLSGAYCLFFNSGYVYPLGSNYRAYGFSVRPVAESKP